MLFHIGYQHVMNLSANVLASELPHRAEIDTLEFLRTVSTKS